MKGCKRCRDSAEVQRCRGSEVLSRCRGGAEVILQVQRWCRAGAEEEVQRRRRRAGAE